MKTNSNILLFKKKKMYEKDAFNISRNEINVIINKKNKETSKFTFQWEKYKNA